VTTQTHHTPTMLAVVESMARAGRGVLLIELAPAVPEESFPSFTAGAHIDLHLGPVIRQYSLLGDPTAPDAAAHWFIAVRRDDTGRGGSRVIHDQLRVGHTLEITGPRNHFPMVDAPGRSILLAGGIGVTPLVAIARTCLAEGRPFALHRYAADTRALPLSGYLGERLPATDHLSDHGDSLRHADRLPEPHRPGDHLYICGPAGFMDRAVALAAADGWPEDAVHTEHFTPVVRDSLPAESFAVTVASTGMTYPVPEDRSIAEALRDNGVPVELSCEAGMCGACLTGVLDGVPDHRDSVQSPSEHRANTHVTLCCSRSTTPTLTLEL
jgi:vanillate O-demethylase ferredoxin subunit